MKLVDILREIKINTGQLTFNMIHDNDEHRVISYEASNKQKINADLYLNSGDDNYYFMNVYGIYYPDNEITSEEIWNASEELVDKFKQLKIPIKVDKSDGDGGYLYYTIKVPHQYIKKYIK